MRSSLTVTTRLPSGLNAALETKSVSIPSVVQMRAVRSGLAVTISCPSGLNAAVFTEVAWPRRTATRLPVATSHTRALRSAVAVTISSQSGLNATVFTWSP